MHMRNMRNECVTPMRSDRINCTIVKYMNRFHGRHTALAIMKINVNAKRNDP